MHDQLKDRLAEADQATNTGETAANQLGEGDKKLQKAQQDHADGDQDAQDKADNMADGGADALRDGGDAMDTLGLGDAGDALRDAADAIDGATDFLGKRLPVGPDGEPFLPDAHFHFYFAADGALDQLKDGLIDGALEQADSLAALAKDVPVLGGFTKNAVSSFFDDDPTPDRARDEPQWVITSFVLTEGLNELFRCEIELQRDEYRSPYQAAAAAGGGLLDSIVGPVQEAIAVAERAKSAAQTAIATVKDLFADPSSALDLLGGGDDEGGPDKEAGPKAYANVPLDPAEWLGQRVSVSLCRHEWDAERYPYLRRWVTGIVSELSDLGVRRVLPPPVDGEAPDTVFGRRRVRIVLVPELYRLSLRRDCRIWQDKTALEIVRDVFREAGIYGMLPAVPGVGAVTGFASGLASKIGGPVGDAASDALSGQFIKTLPPRGRSEQEWTAKREYCVQYNETDLDFVLRLLEEEGITFFFAQEKGSEKLVLCDDPSVLDHCKTVDGRGVPYLWSYDRAAGPPVEIAWNMRQRARLTSSAVVVRDYNFSAVVPTELSARAADTTHEVYEWPGHAHFQYDGEQPHYRTAYKAALPADCTKEDRDLAKLRLEAIAAQSYVGSITSNLICARPGTTLRLKRVLRPEVTFRGLQQGEDPELPDSHTFLIRRAVHRAGVLVGLARGDGYVNELEIQWLHEDPGARIAFRPERRTPKPIMRGLATATVVDEDGDDDEDQRIHFDHPTIGRVRLRFHWDRKGDNPLHLELPLVDRGTTAWVRVAQQWAGADYGVTFLPRAGMEVLVSFLDGDPDRPLVVGCLYNGENLPAFDAPHKSGFRTRTNPRDEGYVDNQLVFEDEYDKERIFQHASQDLIEEVRDTHKTTVLRNQKNTVDGAHGEIVEKKQSLTVDLDRQETITKDDLIDIGVHQTEIVGRDNTVVVVTQRKETVTGKEVIEIGPANRVETQSYVRTLRVHGDRVTRIGEPHRETKKAHDLTIVKETKRDRIVGALQVLAGGLAAGQPSGERADRNQAGFRVAQTEKGPLVTLEADETIAIDSKGPTTIRAERAGVNLTGIQKRGLTIELAQGAEPGDNCVRLLTHDPGPTIQLLSKKRVTIESMHSTLIRIEPARAVLLADGGDASAVLLEGDKIALAGEGLAVSMTHTIELDGSGGVSFAAGAPPKLDPKSYWPADEGT